MSCIHEYIEQFLRRTHDCYGENIESNKDPLPLRPGEQELRQLFPIHRLSQK